MVRPGALSGRRYTHRATTPSFAAATATFGEPLLLDLDGQSIREIRKNANGQYLIIGGTPGKVYEAPAFSEPKPADDA